MTKGKRKNSGQASSPMHSPSHTTDPTKLHIPAGNDSSATHSSNKSVPPFPPEPPPLQPLPPAPAEFTSTQASHVWSLVQTIPSDLRVFLESDYEAVTKYKKILKVHFYRILLHFNPATKSRVNHLKADLNAAFKKDVLPLLQPYLVPQAPAPMETDDISKDFSPLGRKTTRKMLIEAIRQKAPNVPIPTSARRDGLLLLYQQHVDKDLIIPGQTKTIRKPHAIRPTAVEGTDMEDLRLGLQCHAPGFPSWYFGDEAHSNQV